MANHTRSSTKRRPAEERFWEKVNADGVCWEWDGARKPSGYGNFCPQRPQTVQAHRFAYESLIGPIPAGMTIDHLCRNRRCVNPDHFRLASQRDNNLAGQSLTAVLARATHCKKGHPYHGDNLAHYKGQRRCVACLAARNERRRRPVTQTQEAA